MHLLIDTHVHCYRHDDLPKLLISASKNMESSFNGREKVTRVLFFTNSILDDSWLYITQLQKENTSVDGWAFTSNDRFVVASNPDYGDIYLAPARQVNTQERLELLLLGISNETEEALPAEEYFKLYSKELLIICPWGVGKWLGKRGSILTHLQKNFAADFVLGDNGGRPIFWQSIRHFRFAKKIKQSVLNGSDPLPISNEIQRVGSFGIEAKIAEGSFTLDTLIHSLKKQPSVNTGSLMAPHTFLINRYKLTKSS